MAEQQKIAPTSPAQPRQMSIALESNALWGLTDPERMKVVVHLARLLMLAAGVAAAENNDEH